MKPELPHVELGLVALRELFAKAGVDYVLVGGVAVVHHGYVRTTKDLDVLLERSALEVLEPHLANHGFERASECRLRHTPSGVEVDLLFAGEPRPRANTAPYPHPANLGRSEREPDVASLAALVELKLVAARYQDLADLVALLKPLDEADCLRLEAATPPTLRPQLFKLRRDALKEG